MPISFPCACGKQLKVGDQFAGKRARCPACAAVVQVPEAPPPAPDDAAFELLSIDDEPTPPSKRSREEPPPLPPPTVARRPAKADDDETPYRMSAGYEPDPPKRKSERDLPKFKGHKAQRREARDRERSGVSISAGVLGGVGLMLVAAIWFIAGLANGTLFFYPPFMFIGGLVGVVKGVMGHSED